MGELGGKEIIVHITINEQPFVLAQERYATGHLRLQIYSVYREPYWTVTVNIPERPLSEGQVYIKIWEENEEILEQLVAQGILQDTGRREPCGYTFAAIAAVMVPITAPEVEGPQMIEEIRAAYDAMFREILGPDVHVGDLTWQDTIDDD